MLSAAMKIRTRSKAILLVALVLSIPIAVGWDVIAGPQFVIVDGDRLRPVVVSFLSDGHDYPLWRLTGRSWFGWPSGDGTIRIACRVGDRVIGQKFGYVTTGPPTDAIHVIPARCRQ